MRDSVDGGGVGHPVDGDDGHLAPDAAGGADELARQRAGAGEHAEPIRHGRGWAGRWAARCRRA